MDDQSSPQQKERKRYTYITGTYMYVGSSFIYFLSRSTVHCRAGMDPRWAENNNSAIGIPTNKIWSYCLDLDLAT